MPVVKFDSEDTVEINASNTERADRRQLNSQRRGSLPNAAGNHREIGAIRPMALKCVTCGLLFRNRNELDWHVREEHLERRLPPAKDQLGACGYTRHWCSQPSPYLRRKAHG